MTAFVAAIFLWLAFAGDATLRRPDPRDFNHAPRAVTRQPHADEGGAQ